MVELWFNKHKSYLGEILFIFIPFSVRSRSETIPGFGVNIVTSCPFLCISTAKV